MHKALFRDQSPPLGSSVPWGVGAGLQSDRPRSAAGGPRSAERGKSHSGDAADQRPRILIVEDDFIVAAQMEDALTEAGFDVVDVAASADEAVEIAAEGKPALVVMDVMLPGGRDGIDAAIALFRDLGLRCVFATAFGDDHARRRAEAVKPLGWLHKPYPMAVLVGAVSAALREIGPEDAS